MAARGAGGAPNAATGTPTGAAGTPTGAAGTPTDAAGTPTDTAGPGRRRRQPPEIRRQMIIAAARTMIAERGMHATTVRDIAGAADVAVGTVTYHFSGIAEVLAGVLEAEMAEYSAPVMAAAREAPTGRAGLLVLTDGLLATGPRASAHWRLWLDFWALAARYPHYSHWQSQVYRDLHGLAAGLLRRGRRDGTLAVRDADRQSVEYIAMMDGLVVQGYLPDSRLDPDRARAMLRSFVTATFGAAPEGGPAGEEVNLSMEVPTRAS